MCTILITEEPAQSELFVSYGIRQWTTKYDRDKIMTLEYYRNKDIPRKQICFSTIKFNGARWILVLNCAVRYAIKYTEYVQYHNRVFDDKIKCSFLTITGFKVRCIYNCATTSDTFNWSLFDVPFTFRTWTISRIIRAYIWCILSYREQLEQMHYEVNSVYLCHPVPWGLVMSTLLPLWKRLSL